MRGPRCQWSFTAGPSRQLSEKAALSRAQRNPGAWSWGHLKGGSAARAGEGRNVPSVQRRALGVGAGGHRLSSGLWSYSQWDLGPEVRGLLLRTGFRGGSREPLGGADSSERPSVILRGERAAIPTCTWIGCGVTEAEDDCFGA